MTARTVVAALGAAILVVTAAGETARTEQSPQDVLRPAPNRRSDEGRGPYKKFVIRGVTMIDGTGAPPIGPVDIVVEGNRIAAIRSAGTPGLPLEPGRAPKDADFELDATGMFLMPGFISLHTHAGEAPKNPDAEYPYKLWLAHGITTVRGVGLANHALAAKEQARSARNEIVAPRIVNYQTPGSGWDQGPIHTPAQMRAWVQWASQNGVDGIKFFGTPHDLVEALLDEAQKVKLGTVAHLGQTGVAQMDALEAARLGLDTVTHFYGHFEALMKDYRVQPWPPEMNYNNEQWRFGQVARLWDKIHEPGSPEWKAYLQEHIKLGTTFDPTMTAYAAGRDVMRMRTAEWHDKYTLPSLMDFYTPSLVNHGAYFHDWTSTDEVAWRNFYQVWFKLLNDYKNMGGRVTVSADEAFIYNTYGFGHIHEMELLHEAGFNPLEVIQAATFNPARTLAEPSGQPIERGVVRVGYLADMVLVDQNPLHNLKVLYGTGALRLNYQSGEVERIGGIKYTIKDGIIYDAKQLLADVAAMVQEQKDERAKKTNGKQ